MGKEYYQEHRKNSFIQWAYSVQRIDLLIVAISGAGIYICLESLRYSLEHNTPNTWALKICGGIFIISLIVNFISQFTGEKTHRYEMMWADEKLINDDVAAKDKEVRANCYSKATGILNIVSMGAMFIGLLSLLMYFIFTF